MKKFALDFLHRGLTACGIGPVVLAILYLILQRSASVDTLTVEQVSTGIFSITALAFVAGGMNAVYQVERLPLMVAILLHGSVLYSCYLVTYLLNDWLERGAMPIVIFSAVFVAGYLLIWTIIYLVIRRNTEKVNQLLKQKQRSSRDE